jgi:hypothetical protein
VRRLPRSPFVAVLVAALPVELYLSPDSSGTSVQVLGGGGRYALISRDCSGEITRSAEASFGEVGVELEHRKANGLTLGVRGTYASDEVFEDGTPSSSVRSRDVLIAEPYVGAEWRRVGFGGGLMVASEPLHVGGNGGDQEEIDLAPAAHLRFGDRRGLYASASLFDHIPLFTTGYLRLGLGYGGFKRFDGWIGAGGGPQDRGGLVGDLGFSLDPSWTLGASFRLGQSEGIDENAATLGLTYHHIPRPSSEDRASDAEH